MCYLKPHYHNFKKHTTPWKVENWHFICHMCVFLERITVDKNAVTHLDVRANNIMFYATGDYLQRIVSSFSHLIQSEHYGGNRSVSIEGIAFDHFSASNQSSLSFTSQAVSLQAVFCSFSLGDSKQDNTTTTVVVKRQAEEGEKRAPHKLRAQRNLKLKTRARLNKRTRKQKRNKALESNLRLS